MSDPRIEELIKALEKVRQRARSAMAQDEALQYTTALSQIERITTRAIRVHKPKVRRGAEASAGVSRVGSEERGAPA